MTRATSFLVIGFIVAFCGCSGPPTLVPVSGVVHIDGKPASFVQVHFYPPELTAENLATRRAIGTTDAQGRFKLTCGKGEGVEAGKYKVTFFRPLVGGKPVFESGGHKPEGAGVTESIPEAYRKPETTPIDATVPKGGGELPPFDIKMK